MIVTVFEIPGSDVVEGKRAFADLTREMDGVLGDQRPE